MSNVLTLTLSLSKTWRSFVIALSGDTGTEPRRLFSRARSLSISIVPIVQSRCVPNVLLCDPDVLLFFSVVPTLQRREVLQ